MTTRDHQQRRCITKSSCHAINILMTLPIFIGMVFATHVRGAKSGVLTGAVMVAPSRSGLNCPMLTADIQLSVNNVLYSTLCTNRASVRSAKRWADCVGRPPGCPRRRPSRRAAAEADILKRYPFGYVYIRLSGYSGILALQY
eukprot:5638086-Pleurochrysis_carterae.AAC.1